VIEHRGRPANERDLAAIKELLRDRPGVSDTELARVLTSQSRRFTRSMVNSRLRTLRTRGLIDARNVLIQPDLWPAYLLLEVPKGRARAVREAIGSHPERATHHQVVGLELECNLLVATSASDLNAVDALRLRCLRAGALVARAVYELPAAK
jgi:hypothetical protein